MKKLLACLCLFTVFTSCEKAATHRKVVYEIKCSDCDAFLTNESGGNDSRSVKGSQKFEYSIPIDEFAYASAQNNLGSGSVSVLLYGADKLRDSETSSGAYCIASASWTVE